MNDSIEVGAVFTQRGMRLVWLSWQGRRRLITQLLYHWQACDGARRIRYFNVTDGARVYELCFDAQTLRWRLTNIDLQRV